MVCLCLRIQFRLRLREMPDFLLTDDGSTLWRFAGVLFFFLYSCSSFSISHPFHCFPDFWLWLALVLAGDSSSGPASSPVGTRRLPCTVTCGDAVVEIYIKKYLSSREKRRHFAFREQPWGDQRLWQPEMDDSRFGHETCR